jgi:hypothetical protein
MFLFDYIYSLFFIKSTNIITQNKTEIDEDDLFIVKPIIIHDINKIQLKPMKDRVLKEPIYTKIDVKNLNKNQLNEILNVKLKKSNTSSNQKQQKFEPRHPVLKELLQKAGKI